MNIAPLIALGTIGAVAGGQLNRAIYRWAWDQRAISPWSGPPAGVSPRTWSDCIPIVGWWQMRRESPVHGTGFWLRPALIELAWTLGLPAFYWWSVVQGGQLAAVPPPNPAWLDSLQVSFVAHAVLFALMTIATFIDFDEKTIPDFVTIPGTLFALALVWCFPNALLPIGIPPEPLLLVQTSVWPAWLDGPSSRGLLIALACWIGWCMALLPITVYWRRGVGFGLKILLGSIFHRSRRWISTGLIAICVVGIAAICLAWQSNGLSWRALLSSLVGLAAAGGLVWSIRIVAGQVLGVEAMGFGDVTLMFMIGAFFGWQASMICFFLAPFTSVGIAGAQWLLTGESKIAFGPFLCAGATLVILGWKDIWQAWGRLFQGPEAMLLIGTLAVCIVLMGVMLAVIQVIKRMLGFQAIGD